MILLKIGGGEGINIQGIAQDLQSIDEPVIIVHGANEKRDELLAQLGMEKKIITSISGVQSVFSTVELLDTMLMTYAGLKNKRIVETLQQHSINAIGLTGADGGLIRGKRNQGIRVRENGKKKLLRDLSGKAKSINVSLLEMLLENGYTPVLTMPILDENNVLVNSENDDLVALLAIKLQPRKIIMLIENPGFMDTTNRKIDQVSLNDLDRLLANTSGRIKRKLMSLRTIVDNATECYMSDGRAEHPLKSYPGGTRFSKLIYRKID